jgi:hypothetical protein
MSRPRTRLRDVALVYASRGIPVLPLHHPLPDLSRRSIPDGEAIAPTWSTGCSCRDRACGQVGKHPLGSLVPHGLKDATINRARILAWWTRYPQANIGLATGHRFDVLDIDGPAGGESIRTFATEHGLTSSGPLARTGGSGWHYYLAPTGLGNVRPRDLEHVDWRGRGGYVVAPQAATPLATTIGSCRAATSRCPSRRCPPHYASASNLGNSTGRSPRTSPSQAPTGPKAGTYRQPLPRSWPESPPPPWASATASCGNQPATSTTWSPQAPWTTGRSTRGSWRRPSAVGYWPRSHAKPAAPWPPAARSAWPVPAAHDSQQAPNAPTPHQPHPPGRPASEPRRGGERHGRSRPPGRLTAVHGWARAAAKQSPRPPHHPQRRTSGWVARQP